ncbi:MAG: RNA polymerase sigma factor, partial [Gammaproteobacteria bacterium]|nr:RNA polymerase sigma factor [Gammaproteobacteria bacterium]
MRHRQLKQQLEQHWHRLYRLAYSWCHDPQLSQDLAQDTVAKALSKGHQLRDHQAFEAWLFSILINCWRDTCRQR